jgi:hypothetical protein
MMRQMAKGTMSIARGTALTVGVAVMVALVLGVATTALAGTGVGAGFQLGKTNTVDAITRLVGSVAGPSLIIDNGSTGTGATALDLRVEGGKAPMKVNSGTKVANLNADKLDNLDSSAFARPDIVNYATLLGDGTLLMKSSHVVSASRTSTGKYYVDFDRDVDNCVHFAQPLEVDAATTQTLQGSRYGGPNTQVKVVQFDSAGSPVDGGISLAVFCEHTT